VATELGFSRVSSNSLDAVSDRDFILEYLAAASICMMHLSRLAEELVLWSSAEFGFIEIDDAYATGSSIMPQKKNPDVAELARGKTGRVYGSLMAMLTTLKGLPLAYNKDMQEDKEGFFDTVDILLSTLEVFTSMVKTLKIKPENTAASVNRGYILATDLADYLVKKGETFRKAHETVGRLVSYMIETSKSFSDIGLNEYKRFSPLFAEDVYEVSIESSLNDRNIVGGTAKNRVEQALVRAKGMLK
jgi:argininosuccinate lyase